MVDRDEGQIVLFHVAAPGKPTEDIEAFLENILPTIDAPRSLFKIKFAIARERLSTLLEEADNYDLVVIGKTGDPLFTQHVRLPLPEEFARDFKKPLIMVKAKQPLQNFIKRWI